MSLKAGIIGLPNVGKSTLFNAITNNKVEAENYPFATINPNFGVVELEDKRIDNLVSIFNPFNVVKATFQFCDIAGLVKGASKGEGLGNKFLSNIREVDAICHVVRCFEDKEVLHVDGRIDPIEDINIIEYELILSDLEIIEKRLIKIEKKAKTTKDKEIINEYILLKKIKSYLEEGVLLNKTEISNSDLVKSYNLLTNKKMIYVANLKEEELENPYNNKHYDNLHDFAKTRDIPLINISAKIEHEISTLEKEEQQELLNELGVNISGLDRLTKTAFKILNLRTFFTVGKDEVRAWPFKYGMNAKECAGVIHSDFQRGFIKAEISSYNDMIKYKSEKLLKENGKVKIEGKDYIVKDGDIIHFRFNV